MYVVVEIQGRAAVPVRAIPFLTDWREYSPAGLVRIFAEDEDIYFPHKLSTWRLAADGQVVEVESRFWLEKVREIAGVSEELNASGLGREAARQKWRREALRVLPGGVFVWRSDLDAFVDREVQVRTRGPDTVPSRFAFDYDEEVSGDSWRRESIELATKLAERYRLNYQALIEPAFIDLIADGFGQADRAVDSVIDSLPLVDEWERVDQRMAELIAEDPTPSGAHWEELEHLRLRKLQLDIRRRWLRGDGHGQNELDFREGFLRVMVGPLAWDAWRRLFPVSAADAALLLDGIDPDSTQARGGPSRLRLKTMEAIGGDGRPRRLTEWLADLIQFERQVESREACEPSVPSIHSGSAPTPAERQVIQRMKTAERRDALTPIIEQAMQRCKDQTDAAEVWGHLSAMAEKKVGPLLGSTEDGIQYLKDGLAASLTKDALRKRVGRMSGRIPP